jgi:hypothetical protein
MFIAYFMALMLSCETIGSIKVLGIVYKFFSVDIVFLYVLPLAPIVTTGYLVCLLDLLLHN